jgi:hypothetical protein
MIIKKYGEMSMESILIATYKERKLFLENDLPLKPMSKIRIKIELPTNENKNSFLDTAISQDFTAPEDWSENVDEYLYDESPK